MITFKLFDRFIIFLVVLVLLADTLNGVLIRLGIPGIASTYKLLILFLMIFRISLSRNFYIIGILVIGIFLSPNLIVSYLEGDLMSLYESGTVVFRFMLIPVSYFFGLLFFRANSRRVGDRFFMRFIYFSFLILSLNLLVGLFGVGFSQYDGDVGQVGFFYSGNEMSAVMIIVFCIVANRVYCRSSLGVYIMLAFLMIVLSLLKATKVGIVGTVFLLITIPLMINYSSISFKINFKRIVNFSLFFGFILTLFPLFINEFMESSLFNRWAFFLNRSDGVIHFLFSGRNNFVQFGLAEFLDYGVFEILFGKGVLGAINTLSPYVGIAKATEIDFFDFLFQFGIIGVLTVYLFFLFLLFQSFHIMRNKIVGYSVGCFLSNVLVLVISLTAGHVFNSGMVGLFIGISNAYNVSLVYGKNS